MANKYSTNLHSVWWLLWTSTHLLRWRRLLLNTRAHNRGWGSLLLLARSHRGRMLTGMWRIVAPVLVRSPIVVLRGHVRGHVRRGHVGVARGYWLVVRRLWTLLREREIIHISFWHSNRLTQHPIRTHYLCHVTGYQPISDKCSGSGDLICGSCQCHSSTYGDHCQVR